MKRKKVVLTYNDICYKFMEKKSVWRKEEVISPREEEKRKLINQRVNQKTKIAFLEENSVLH